MTATAGASTVTGDGGVEESTVVDGRGGGHGCWPCGGWLGAGGGANGEEEPAGLGGEPTTESSEERRTTWAGEGFRLGFTGDSDRVEGFYEQIRLRWFAGGARKGVAGWDGFGGVSPTAVLDGDDRTDDGGLGCWLEKGQRRFPLGQGGDDGLGDRRFVAGAWTSRLVVLEQIRGDGGRADSGRWLEELRLGEVVEEAKGDAAEVLEVVAEANVGGVGDC